MSACTKRRAQRGLSLLEILMAVILLAMCIMATATVFPGGYKLNMSNRYANQATEYARGIIEEINARPFTNPGVSGIDALSLQDLTGWDYTMSGTNLWPYHFYTDINAWKAGSPVRCWTGAPEKFFYLPESAAECPKGIEVMAYPAFGTVVPARDARMAKIQVTVAWTEYRGSQQVTRFVSIVSWRTDNKLDY